jgi:hypothetical protein
MTDHYTEIVRAAGRYLLAVALGTLAGSGIVFGLAFGILAMWGRV